MLNMYMYTCVAQFTCVHTVGNLKVMDVAAYACAGESTRMPMHNVVPLKLVTT